MDDVKVTESVVSGVDEYKPGAEDLSKAKDDAGTKFNAKIHKVDKDGNALKNKKGIFRIRSGAEILSNKKESHALGQVCARSFFALNVVLLGKDFAPVATEEVDEIQIVGDAFEVYLDSLDITELPPATVLLIALAGYYGARFAMPARRAKVLGVFKKAKDKKEDKAEEDVKAKERAELVDARVKTGA